MAMSGSGGMSFPEFDRIFGVSEMDLSVEDLNKKREALDVLYAGIWRRAGCVPEPEYGRRHYYEFIRSSSRDEVYRLYSEEISRQLSGRRTEDRPHIKKTDDSIKKDKT